MSYINKVLPRLPDKTLYDLENRLSEPRFMGVQIGATLTSCLNARLPVNPAAALRAFCGLIRFYWFGPRGCQALPQLARDRILLTLIADTPRLNELVFPVLKELGDRPCNVISGADSIRKRLPPDVGLCTSDQVCKLNMGVWRRAYNKCAGSWHREILKWLHDYKLSIWLYPYLAYAMAIRSLYIYGFLIFLERVKPTVVLTDSEHNHPWSCLILTAKLIKIPTIQMTHGVIYTSYGWYPLLSDVILCWGEQQREQMISFGIESDRLLVTGCQRLSRENCCDGKRVRHRLGLPLDVAVVMVATNPMSREEWRKLVFTVEGAFRDCSGIVAVVKLHPSEKRLNYAEEIAICKGMRFIESVDWTVEESMAACDVVVVHNSGLGNDALVLRRPVVVLDVLEARLNNGRVLADKAGCPVVCSASELHQVAVRIVSDLPFRQKCSDQAEVYVRWFCSSYGQEAARNVAIEVRKRIKPTDCLS